jgi:acetyltransferase
MPALDDHHLPDGTPVALRAVCPRDTQALSDLIEGLSPRDRRWRFHGAVTGVAPARLERMACLDPQRELAFVAATAAGGPLLVDVRCVVDAGGDGAEFALMVAAGRRRLGLGAWALAGLRQAAAQRGLRWLYGSTLADNLPMLDLLRAAGFRCTPHRADRRLVVAELCLQPDRVACH